MDARKEAEARKQGEREEEEGDRRESGKKIKQAIWTDDRYIELVEYTRKHYKDRNCKRSHKKK